MSSINYPCPKVQAKGEPVPKRQVLALFRRGNDVNTINSNRSRHMLKLFERDACRFCIVTKETTMYTDEAARPPRPHHNHMLCSHTLCETLLDHLLEPADNGNHTTLVDLEAERKGVGVVEPRRP